jgi:peptidoglycan/xylan/chitin deacetylase (PgdA/CDA1 family)
MRTLKEFGYRLLVLMGLPRIMAWLNRRKALVLEYHDVYAGAVSPALNFDGLHVRLQQFESQMRYLAVRYHVVGLHQMLPFQAVSPLRKPLAAITIDDGYKNTYRYAVPILQRLGLPATAFIVSDFCLHGRALWWDRLRTMIATTRQPSIVVRVQDTEQQFPLISEQDKLAALRQLSPEIHNLPPKRREALLAELAVELGVDEQRTLATCEPISVAELREMVEGGISVGSHGRSHDSFLHLSREELLAELTESKRALESAIGRPVTWLAYPYGELSQTAIETASRAGYRGAVTTIEGLNDMPPANPYIIRRIRVNDNMSLAHFIVAVSGLRDFLKTLFRIGEAERAMPMLAPERGA